MAVKKKAVKSKTATIKKSTAKKTTGKKTAKKATGKKVAARKTATKKKTTAGSATAARKKTASKKAATAGRKTSAKKAPAKKTTTRQAAGKAASRTTAARKTTARSSSPAAQVGPVPGIAPYMEKKGEEYMNDKQIEHFRNILQTWKRSLMEEVDRTVHHMQDDAANFPDPNDRATQESEFSMELRARDRERKLIKKIEESIRHLDSNDFGYCEACGVEIGVRRLEARPTATLCIDCKILDEIREKQMG